MVTVRESWSKMWSAIITDVHPPLYYIMLKLIMIITNYNFKTAKIFSLLPIILMNLIVITLTLKDENKLYSKKTGILLSIFTIAITLTGNFLYMGQELRMYSLATFFVTISGIYAYKTYNDTSKKNIAILIISSLASALTHYFALIMEMIIYCFLFIALLIKNRKYIKQICIITGITILGYSWWLPTGIKQFLKVKKNFWLQFNLRSDFAKYIKGIFGTTINKYLFMCIALFMIVLCVCVLYNLIIRKKYKSNEKKEIIFALLMIMLPFIVIGIGTILNILVRPIFTTRYMMPALGLFWLGIVILLNYIEYKRIFISLAVILVLTNSIMEYPKAYKKEIQNGTADTLKFANANIEDNDILTSTLNHLTWTVLKFYFPNNEIKTIDKVDFSKDNKTIWLFWEGELPDDLFKVYGYNQENMYTGNIDNNYFFNVYKLEKNRNYN